MSDEWSVEMVKCLLQTCHGGFLKAFIPPTLWPFWSAPGFMETSFSKYCPPKTLSTNINTDETLNNYSGCRINNCKSKCACMALTEMFCRKKDLIKMNDFLLISSPAQLLLARIEFSCMGYWHHSLCFLVSFLFKEQRLM